MTEPLVSPHPLVISDTYARVNRDDHLRNTPRRPGRDAEKIES